MSASETGLTSCSPNSACSPRGPLGHGDNSGRGPTRRGPAGTHDGSGSEEDRRTVATLAAAKANLKPKPQANKAFVDKYNSVVEFRIGESHYVKSMESAIEMLRNAAEDQTDTLIDYMRKKNDAYLTASISELLSGAPSLRGELAGLTIASSNRVKELERAARKYPNEPVRIRAHFVSAVESINECRNQLHQYRLDVIVGADRGVIATEILIGVVITVYTGGLGVGFAKAAAVEGGLTAFAGLSRAASEKWVYNLRDDIPVSKILIDSGTACAGAMLSGAWQKAFESYLKQELAKRGMTFTEKFLKEFISETAKSLVGLISVALTQAFVDKRTATGEEALKIGVGAVLNAIIGVAGGSEALKIGVGAARDAVAGVAKES